LFAIIIRQGKQPEGYQMKERPIIFNTDMVRAILDGRKTQTRRVVKTPAKYKNFYLDGAGQWTNSKTGEWHDIAYDAMLNEENGMASFLVAGDMGWDGGIPCPYGTVGDRLWVRETFTDTVEHMPEGIYYKANYSWADAKEFFKWKPSIHMPRGASRITLEITGVRVERLMDISERDAIAEGVEFLEKVNVFKNYQIPYPAGWFYPHQSVDSFRTLWDSTNKKHPWNSNPWVWVIEFKKV
jgi:hypothetical protein